MHLGASWVGRMDAPRPRDDDGGTWDLGSLYLACLAPQWLQGSTGGYILRSLPPANSCCLGKYLCDSNLIGGDKDDINREIPDFNRSSVIKNMRSQEVYSISSLVWVAYCKQTQTPLKSSLYSIQLQRSESGPTGDTI